MMRQTHRAGEKMFVDFAGETVPIVDPVSGEIEHAYVYVAVLGASNYTYSRSYDGAGFGIMGGLNPQCSGVF
jgi:transposase